MESRYKYEASGTRSKAKTLAVCFVLSTLYMILSTPGFGQYTRHWIQFTDKNNSPYSVSTPSAFLSARAIQRRINQGIAVVQNDLPVNPAYYDSVKNVPNVTIINRSKWFNAVTIYTTDTNALNTIKAFSFVTSTKPVGRYRGKIENDYIPIVSEAKYQNSTLSTYNYGPSYNQIKMLEGVCMHDQGFDGKGIQIAVLDAGFYKVDTLPMFDSLRANGQILGTWDFVENDTMVYDAHSHGAMVLSTMGANLPGVIIGTAPKAQYWLLKTEEGVTEYVVEEDNWVSGAEFADSCGADILTTSLGYTDYDSIMIDTIKVANPDSHTYADMDGNTCRISIGTDIAVSKGMFAVCSAGNSGGNSWHYIGAPADADSVLAVGAVDSLTNYAGFSSTGPSYDGRVKPNVAAQGQDAVTADPWSANVIGHFNGTSFACPITAGMVACLWQAHPNSTNMELFNAIQQTASQYSNPDSLKGYGVPNFCWADYILAVPDNSSIENNFLSVYPNPFSESTVISVQGVQANGLELIVYDILGNKVYQEVLNAQQINLNLKLAKGMYTAVLKDGSNFPKAVGAAKLVKY